MTTTAPSVPVILVTGATGKVGCAVIRTLLSSRFPSDSFQVRAAAKEGDKLKACKQRHPQLEVVELDYEEQSSYAAALRGVSSVLLVTGYTVDMLVHSKLFTDACKAAGVKYMVHLGVDLPGGAPLKVVIWHALIERYIESSGFHAWAHLHPTFYMENLISYGQVPTIRSQSIVTIFKPEAKVTWVSAEDVGRFGAHVLADPSTYSGRAYPLAVDAASHAEWAELLSKMTGESFAVKEQPFKVWYDFVRSRGQIDLVDFVNKGGKGSPVERTLSQRVTGVEAKSLPDWTQEHLQDIKSSS